MKKFKVSEATEITNSKFANLLCTVCRKEVPMGDRYISMRIEQYGARAAFTNLNDPHKYFCDSQECVNIYILQNM